MIKPLNELTEKEYTEIKQTGMFWEKYPHATGSYSLDAAFKEAKETVSPIPIFYMFEGIKNWYTCSYCKSNFILKAYKFCPDCGKKLQW